MFNFSKNKNAYIVSLSLEEGGLSVAAKKENDWDDLILGNFTGDFENISGQLNQFVDQNDLKNSKCHFVLSLNDYLLIQTDKPSVPDKEINEAVRWKIGDLVPWDPADIAVETFCLPKGGFNNQESFMAAVSPITTIEKMLVMCRNAGLKPVSIEITELVIKRLISQPDETQGIALILFTKKKGVVCLYHQNTLYLSRVLGQGAETFSGNDPDIREQGIYEQIALDLQRSLDFFESTFSLGGINRLYVYPNGKRTEHFSAYLKENLFLNPITTKEFDAPWGQFIDDNDLDLEATALIALAGLENEVGNK